MEPPRPEEKEKIRQERDYRGIIGNDAYESLSLLDQAEFNLLAKTVMEDRVTDRQALIEKVYGDLTSGGLTRRLSKKFNLRFAKGQLEKIKNPQPPMT